MNEVEIKVPFGQRYISAKIPSRNLLGIYTAPGISHSLEPEKEILRALENPIGSPPLADIVRPRMKTCIVVSDITRPVPYRIVFPLLIKYLNRYGIRDEDITLLVATGLHRGLTEEEKAKLYGEETVRRVKVINHDYSKGLVSLGKTSNGTPIEINRIAVESDLLILTGYIEPHQQFGFTGGRKSLMPGIASEKAVMHNHGPQMMDHPLAVNGVIEGNPQHEDAMEFAKAIKVDFILNLVLNQDQRLCRAVAGNIVEAWLKGVELSKAFREVTLPEACDVAITASGYPLDQVLYQGPKITSAVFRVAQRVIRDGGTIILPMEATEGIGHHREFYELMCVGNGDPKAIIERCYSHPTKDQWGAQIWARTLEKLNMIIVTERVPPSLIERMGIKHCYTLQEAVEQVIAQYGPNCKIAVFPKATSVLPKIA